MVRHFLSPVVTKAVTASVVVGALLLVSARAQAQTPDSGANNALGQGFGAQGQIAISGDLGASFDKVNHGGWRFGITPAADYFLAPSISAGAVLGLVLGNDSYSEEIARARVGYNLNVTPMFGLWPKAGIAFDHTSTTVGNTKSTTNTTWLTIDAPLMVNIVPHLFVGFGPYYYLKIAGGGNTGFGAHSLVGGWF
jgi:hypothetical protein